MFPQAAVCCLQHIFAVHAAQLGQISYKLWGVDQYLAQRAVQVYMIVYKRHAVQFGTDVCMHALFWFSDICSVGSNQIAPLGDVAQD